MSVKSWRVPAFTLPEHVPTAFRGQFPWPPLGADHFLTFKAPWGKMQDPPPVTAQLALPPSQFATPPLADPDSAENARHTETPRQLGPHRLLASRVHCE